MIETSLPAAVVLVTAAIPALLFVFNLALYRRLPRRGAIAPVQEGVSVLIPARDEEHGIGDAVRAVLASTDVEFEVIVLDDASTDGTAGIVEALRAADARVRLERSPGLPAEWCGKQHACQLLSQLARYPVFLFLDADVRLQPDAVARVLLRLERGDAQLVSGFPQQVTGTFLERLLIPLIHFLLLGFLPVVAMRRSLHPAFGAGCGQLFACRREHYAAAGGHAAIRKSLHDGITLPRAFRRAGLATDIFDATDLASCRMYRTTKEVWHGLAKNATEGLAHPKAILPWTFLLGLGQVLPSVLLIVTVTTGGALWGGRLTGLAVALGYLPRLLAVVRFRQSLLGALLHPLGVAALLAIQWYALGRRILRLPPSWKGRPYLERP